MRDLAEVYSRLKRYSQAEPLFLRALEGLEGRPKDDPIVVLTKCYLADMYAAQKRYHKADPLLKENLDISRRKFGHSHPEVARLLARLGQNRLMQGEYAAAEPLLRECLAIRAAKLPDVWLTFHARSQLGGSLIGQKKYAEAEPLVLTGYEGMQAREAGLDKKWLIEASARIVALYDAWGKPRRRRPGGPSSVSRRPSCRPSSSPLDRFARCLADDELLSAQYNDPFVFASPHRVQLIKKDDFPKVLPNRQGFFRTVGLFEPRDGRAANVRTSIRRHDEHESGVLHGFHGSQPVTKTVTILVKWH